MHWWQQTHSNQAQASQGLRGWRPIAKLREVGHQYQADGSLPLIGSAVDDDVELSGITDSVLHGLEHQQRMVSIARQDQMPCCFERRSFLRLKLARARRERSHEVHAKGVARLHQELRSPSDYHCSATVDNRDEDEVNPVRVVLWHGLLARQRGFKKGRDGIARAIVEDNAGTRSRVHETREVQHQLSIPVAEAESLCKAASEGRLLIIKLT
jgi:hypothetical protein